MNPTLNVSVAMIAGTALLSVPTIQGFDFCAQDPFPTASYLNSEMFRNRFQFKAELSSETVEAGIPESTLEAPVVRKVHLKFNEPQRLKFEL